MAENFRAIVAEKSDNGEITVGLKELTTNDLPKEKVKIKVDYSTLNYKDGLALTNSAPIVQKFPMVCGIDLAGTVVESLTNNFSVGDRVLVNGFGLSERHWGGYSELQRVNPDFLVKIPESFSSLQAMAIGTAGYTAMLAVNAIRDKNISPESGIVLVTGAAGGVGSVGIMLLSKLGYQVAASTGRASLADYLRELGATEILGRDEFARKAKPLEKENWAACIDSVGSTTLATVLAQTRYDGLVAACGLAGGTDLPATVIPFLLRNVTLQGIDSVMAPMSARERAWRDLATILDKEALEKAISVVPLDKTIEIAGEILEGNIRGRTVIDVNA